MASIESLRLSRFFPLLVLTGLASGCAQIDLHETLRLPGTKPLPAVPTRMSDMWTETVMTQTGEKPVRGFGGRVMFYNHHNSSEPVRVDGKFIVFVFDAEENQAVSTVPERVFVFPRERLDKHSSKSKLGYSYSFWLPWDDSDGPERRLMVVCKFEAANGEVVLSNPSRQILPGVGQPNPLATKGEIRQERIVATAQAGQTGVAPEGPSGNGSAVQPVSYNQPLPATKTNPPADASQRMTTSTIDVPPSFARPDGKPAAVAAATPAAAEVPGGNSTSAPAAPAVASSARATAESPATTDSAPSTGSAPSRFPARRATVAPLKRDPVRRQPLPSTWPSPLPPTPRTDPTNGSLNSPVVDLSKSN